MESLDYPFQIKEDIPHQAQTGDWLFHIKYPFKQQNYFGPREGLIYTSVLVMMPLQTGTSPTW